MKTLSVLKLTIGSLKKKIKAGTMSQHDEKAILDAVTGMPDSKVLDARDLEQIATIADVDLEELASLKESEKKQIFEPKKWYAFYMGHIVGPYDSEDAAYDDCGGDVDWIKQGQNIIKKLDALW